MMTRFWPLDRFGVVATWLALAAVTCGSQMSRAADRSHPNVLFLLADDMGPDAIRAFGHPVIETPNLDALARSGFVFRNAYCLGGNSAAVCLPSRNMILSGRAYFRWKGPYASADDPNFPDSMHQAGYETYHHGKRGNVALKIQERFNHNKYLDDEKERTSGQPGKTIVDGAVEFLQKRPKDRPFFMYLAFEAPHDPRVADPEYLARYDRSKIPLPKNYLPVHPFDNGEMTIRDEKLAAWPRTKPEIRRHLHEYYAVITALDHHIGRLIQSLKDQGEYENTIIVFASDHGLAIGSHGLMGKQNLYEHSTKAPLIFEGPGIPKGESDALVYLLDIYPTVCELVGAKVPDGLDGQSLAGIIHGTSASVRESLFTSYQEVQRAVRDGQWKIIRYPQINRTQLFDLKTDPDEMHDLAGDPSQAARIDRMMALLKDWQTRLGDTAPLTSDHPRDPTFVPPTGNEPAPLKPQPERLKAKTR